MNRRRFFKTFLAVPLLAPLFGDTGSILNDCTFYLIGENPHVFFPPLLEEMQRIAPPHAKYFHFLHPHPQQHLLKGVLLKHGWQENVGPAQRGLSLSFCRLRDKAAPSFAFVKSGQIWDARDGTLHSVWKEMGQNDPASSCLTIAHLRKRTTDKDKGKSLRLYADGYKRGEYPLKDERRFSFSTQKGHIRVQIAGGEGWVSDSSCRGKICLCSPPISRPGERIICAPNHFFMEIQGPSLDTVIG
jgi:hypothetical protein